MLTDPIEVARRAKELEAENWRFRSYLKSMCSWSDAKLNRVAAELGREAAAQINCLDCGACCRGIYVPVTDEEIERLASRLPITARHESTRTADRNGHSNECSPRPSPRPSPSRGEGEIMSLPVLQFRAAHVKATEFDPQVLDAHPCPFQSGNVCTVYDARPTPCREYPYLEGDIRARLFDILERGETCPIVFEQLEQLKRATGFRRSGSRR